MASATGLSESSPQPATVSDARDPAAVPLQDVAPQNCSTGFSQEGRFNDRANRWLEARVFEKCPKIGQSEFDRATGRFFVYDALKDGRFVWGRLAICDSYDYYGNCIWRRINNLMSPRSGEYSMRYNSIRSGTRVRIQTCVSEKHQRTNLVYCSKVHYTTKL
jgi:hypothetical protein